MEIEIQLTNELIAEKISAPSQIGAHGAWIEFRGVVRDLENGGKISALEYEAYPEMAEREIRRLLEEIAKKNPCLAAKVIHRVGIIPVGETAIYVGVASTHRGEAIALLAEFMNRLKQDVPIWKRRATPLVAANVNLRASDSADSHRRLQKVLPLDEAVSEIQSRCQPLPGVRVRLEESFGRVLRETVLAAEDLPPFDCSTRDGYAILKNDESEKFQVVDTLHAADWKPRELKPGEAVRIATGAPLPCENLCVVMQENVERSGDKIKILRRENSLNIRKRGEDVKAGAQIVKIGARLNAGKLALLATAGNVNPLVSPRLRICHFTTGDEIVPPSQKPKPGQIRDSNSFLIRGLLQDFSFDLEQSHLSENFEQAKSQIANRKSQIDNADLVLVSGGASVGEKDFTRPLLEWLRFKIVFSQINVRPGRPLIFGVNGNRIAFGLPGNPLSHFVCFHLFVATALAKLIGAEPKKFLRGQLAEKLKDAPCPRETLWPARLDLAGLHPLAWASSGDITCLTETNALVRVPANRSSIDAGTEVEFLTT
ncbi:MAG TPA: molybdenum cofactor biosynthesis protein MoaE [Verrucomicrobiae bacterium]|jgi:molybdopterin molybdotransferase|nr:molybdenum cofactor biosynthesis protein MoaE [Verrucomicrobiae bacterium]